MIDEFFDGVDNTYRKYLFKQVVNKYLKNKTVVYTTNELDLSALSDRIFVMSYGI